MKDGYFENVELVAVSATVPKNRIKLKDYGARYGEEMVDRIINSTGISEVAVAPENQTCSDLCLGAAIRLFEKTGVKPEEVTGLVYVAETPDYIAPTTAAILQDKLGLPKSSIVYEIHLACSGFVYGLFQASLMIESGYCDKVLLLAGSTMTRYMNPEDRAMQMISGDAGCAALLRRSLKNKQMKFNFYSDGSRFAGLYIPAGGIRMPYKTGVTDVLEYDDEGNGHTKQDIIMNGMDIMVFSTRDVPRMIKQLLESVELTVDDLDYLFLHQANKIIIDRIGKLLKISPEKVPIGLGLTGNTGLVSIPLMLCNMFDGINPTFKKTIMCGFGSGLVASACFLDVSETLFIKTTEL